jgi:hypothetical protein
MDNHLIREIKKLKDDIKPRTQWQELSRVYVLKQISQDDQYQAKKVGILGYLKLILETSRQTVFEPAVMMLLVLGLFLGSSLTINAAFYSLPGEGLYKVKLALEKTHVAMMPDEEKKVELKMEFAQKRIAELDKIVSQTDVNPVERKKKLEVVVQEFKNNVVAVSNHLNKLETNDLKQERREQTLRIAITASSKTQELVKSFDEQVADLAQEVEELDIKAIVAEAVATVQESSQTAAALADDVGQDQEEHDSLEAEEGQVKGENIEVETEEITQDSGPNPTETVKEVDNKKQVVEASSIEKEEALTVDQTETQTTSETP